MLGVAAWAAPDHIGGCHTVLKKTRREPHGVHFGPAPIKAGQVERHLCHPRPFRPHRAMGPIHTLIIALARLNGAA